MTLGDNDPIDVCEIGSRVAAVGDVYPVKVLGVLGMIDDGETDWKVIAIATDDPLANKLHDLDDLHAHAPDTVATIRNWFRDYKIPDGKPPSAYDAAKNFGGIGVVIGHEITHGFDNSNHNYDGDGNFNPWWSNATNTTFKTKAQCLSDQYAKFVVNSDLTGAVLGNISGQLALGEAIADNGGLKTSFRAY
ncbi:hypothetical protein DYB25_004961, partial [Aphanomyces astaci]